MSTVDPPRGTAETLDGAVRVVVDASGVPTQLVLTDGIASRRPAELAAQIMRCVRAAQADLAYPRAEQAPPDDEDFDQKSIMIPADTTKDW
jgi:hypothetical protein